MENANVKSKSKSFTDIEREAMKARQKELAAEARSNKKRSDGEEALNEAIAAMSGNDKDMAQKLHAIITKIAPELWPKTWYGMPAYAKEDKIICFFQAAQKFKARYATFGFNDQSMLDDGDMWATSFALRKLTSVEEERIVALVKKALGK